VKFCNMHVSFDKALYVYSFSYSVQFELPSKHLVSSSSLQGKINHLSKEMLQNNSASQINSRRSSSSFMHVWIICKQLYCVLSDTTYSGLIRY
jgi:hypothetical protein